MKKTTLLFLVAVLLFLSGNLFSQEKWSLDPQKMNMAGIGNTMKIPFVIPNYVNPNTKPRIIQSPCGVYAVSANIRVHPNNTNYQSEMYMTRGVLNQSILFGGWNSYTVGQSGSYMYSTGFSTSTNGGANWYGNDTLNSSYGDPGPFTDKFGNICMTYLANPAGVGSSTSTNNGVSWLSQVTINSSSADKNLANSDDNASSPYYGRSYIVWSFWSGTPYIVCSYTTNSGAAWNGPYSLVAATSGNYQQGCDVVTYGTTGNVYVTWACPTGSTYYEAFYGFAKSTNGGVNWTGVDHAFPGNGIRGNLANKNNLRVNSFPRIDVDKSTGPYAGRIYVVFTQKNLAPAGSDPDIVLHWSSDQGTTWSAGIKVNQDALNNGHTQWFPAVKVDASGGVNIAYYDDRNCISSSDSAEIYMSRSIDGGATWTDTKISDVKTKIVPISEAGIASYYGGDYIGITVANNRIWPLWMDRRTGVWQAFTAYVDLGPAINHTPLGNTEQTTGTRAVNCTITPAGSGINPSKTKLFFSKTTTWTDSVLMTNSSGINWTANIQMSGPGTYKYYITTTDSLSRTATAPAGAPANAYTFIATPDTIKPVIVHTPIGNTPKSTWPVSVTATVTDNIGIDSVWVKWYKNTPATLSRQFKLNYVSGNDFSAAFNSVNADVNINDSIFYRVFAQDAGSGHLKDSTALIKFKIIQLSSVCIGTGTTSSNYPYGTYWEDGRTDMLFLASEITGAGGYPCLIQKIAFNVISVGGPAMNGFNVKMQNTTATSISAFTNSGWTVCFNGVHTATSGWDTITLTSPYVWNGSGNLLMEVCYNNNSWTAYSPVNATNVSGMMVGYETDLPSGDGCTAAWTASSLAYRCNTCFTITPVNGVGNNSSLIPGTYSLSQNYPNPFNPVTQIKFDIPKQGFVTMKIFDILGREVSKLVNEVKTPGSYIVDFDGSNLSSGVYFYKLEVNNFSDIKKMVLIK